MSSQIREAVISVSDALVHDYLTKNGHDQIAKDLLKIRKREELPNLHGIDLTSVTSQFYSKKVSEDQVLCNDSKCVNNFVFKYLLMNGHVHVAREFKVCTQSRLKEDDHNDMHLADLVEHYENFNYNDRNKWMPIREVFGDKLDLVNELDDGQSEVAKVVRYILGNNIPIRKEQIDAARLYMRMRLDDFIYPKHAIEGIDARRFSAGVYGTSSDECQIDKARKELIDKALIVNEKKLLEDLYAMSKMQKQWPLCIVGCYLAKYLKAARYPQKVFMKVAKPVLFNTGSLSPEELEVITKHMSTKGKIDYAFLQECTKRTRKDIKEIIDSLTKNKSANLKGRYSLAEDTAILKHVLGDKKPKSYEEFSEILRSPKTFVDLAKNLGRPYKGLINRWDKYLKTVVLSLFHGKINANVFEEFSAFLVTSKTKSIGDIDWNEVLKKFPYCSKGYLMDILKKPVEKRKRNDPLYKILIESRSLPRREMHQAYRSRKEKIAQIFDELRGILPMSESTKEALQKYNL